MIQGRKSCRSGQPCEPRTLAESLYCLAHHSSVGLAEIAEAIGKRAGYLSDAANPDCETVAFQAVALVPAMRAANNNMPLKFMARQMGAVLVQLPDGDCDASDIRARFMATAKELGEVATEIERALSGDDVIDAFEFARIDRELADVVEAVAQMRHAIAKKAGQA
jgi:hypothetical protein